MRTNDRVFNLFGKTPRIAVALELLNDLLGDREALFFRQSLPQAANGLARPDQGE